MENGTLFSGAELLFVVSTLTGLLCAATAAINSLIFYRRFYQPLSEQLDGHVFDPGFLLATSRFMLWGQYCLFPGISRNAQWRTVFSQLEVTPRRQLQLHFILVISGCLAFILAVLLANHLNLK